MSKEPKPVGRSLPSTVLKLGQLRENAFAKESSRNISASETASKESSPLDHRLMDRLWIRMAEIFGHKWTSQYGDSPLDTWAKRLGAMSAEDIAYGVNACASSNLQWPPSLPDFCALCRPDLSTMGVPDEESAFLEASRHSHEPNDYIFSHEAVRLAGEAIGWYDLQRCHPNEESLRKRFKASYGALIGKLQRGESLSKPLTAIGHDGEKTPSELAEEEAERKINERIREQNLAHKTPQQLRAEMLAKLGIKR